MKNLITSVAYAAYLFAAIFAGKYTVEETYLYVQKLALEKAAIGLGDLSPIARQLTGKTFKIKYTNKENLYKNRFQ